MTKNVIFRKWHEKVSFCTDLLTDKAIPVQYYYNWRPSTSYLEQTSVPRDIYLLQALIHKSQHWGQTPWSKESIDVDNKTSKQGVVQVVLPDPQVRESDEEF